MTRDDDGNIVPFTRDDSHWWSGRCDLEAHEDHIHCQWGCPASSAIWKWSTGILALAVAITSTSFTLTCGEALIGIPIPNIWNTFPMMMWHILQGLSNWEIWKARFSLEKEDLEISAIGVQQKIWKELWIYIKIEWRYLMGTVKEGHSTYDGAVA